jgi:cephalosporin hydroxylase
VDETVDAFMRLYYGQEPWKETRWRGVRTLKNPCDLWTYQEIIFEVRPRIIIETGTAYGGSALFFADMMNQYAPGHVITIDVEYRNPPDDPRITCLGGSSTDDEVFNWVDDYVEEHEGPVLVSLDSDHSKGHVLVEMTNYGPLVTPGSYMVVEDTNTDGPREAVDIHLKHGGQRWTPDAERERHLLTFNPGGWLKRTG